MPRKETDTTGFVHGKFGGLPLLVSVALLLLVVVLVIAMMIAFRGKDLADAP